MMATAKDLATEYHAAMKRLAGAEAAYVGACSALDTARNTGRPQRERQKLIRRMKEAESTAAVALCDAEHAHQQYWREVQRGMLQDLFDVAPLIHRFNRVARSAGSHQRAAFSYIDQAIIDAPPALDGLLDAGVPFEAPECDPLSR